MEEFTLSEAEQEFLELYRKADQHDKASVRQILKRYQAYNFNPRVIVGGKAQPQEPVKKGGRHG